MTEEHDLLEFAQSVRDRFVELTEPHRPALWNYYLRLTGSPWDAEDLLQETMLRAFARLSNLWQPIRDSRAYLFRIASNTWIDTLRRAGARPPLDAELPDDLEDAIGDIADVRLDAGEALARLVALLPPRQRVALLLADVFGFANREIGAMIGITEGAVKALLNRARTMLQRRRAELEDGRGSLLDVAVELRPADRAVLASFVDAFNRRDADALLQLPDADASTDIVGAAEEFGRDVIREQSLAEGMASPVPQQAELAFLFGAPAVCVYAAPPDQPRALMWLIRLGLSEGKICRWTAYFFTPELIRHAAAALGVPAAPAGYRYVLGASGGS